jgi:hypothetical protein
MNATTGESSVRSAAPIEEIPADEALFAEKLRQLLQSKMERDYPKGTMRRDAHPKHHGCVRAELIVDSGLPPEFAVGVFSEPKTYDAWVRFSNQSGTPQSDIKGDIRGMAIKLLDVAGPKLLPGAEDCTTHDFILITTDRFVARDVQQFHGLIATSIAGPMHFALFMLLNWRVARNLWSSLEKFGNILEATFTSPTPYLLGQQAVRYRMRPISPTKTPIPREPTDNYLRDVMCAHLANREAIFEFLVQVQTNPERMPIEDPGVRWDETQSPYRRIAALRIPAQRFDSDEQMIFAENLSFNPWRCLVEHRPLGGINRARKLIYSGLSEFRHDRNGISVKEPAQ